MAPVNEPTTTPEAADVASDPPAAPSSVTEIPYGTAQAAWLVILTPLAVLAFVLSVVALVVAVKDGGGGGATVVAPAGSSGATEVTVGLHEFAFDPDVVAVAADTGVSVALDNTGAVQHTWAVLRAGADPADESRVTDDMILTELGPVDPGSTLAGTVNLPAGTYKVICTIPGHFDAGMSGQLVVG